LEGLPFPEANSVTSGEEMQMPPRVSRRVELSGDKAVNNNTYQRYDAQILNAYPTPRTTPLMFPFHERALKRDRIAVMQPHEMKSIDTSLNDATAEKRG
jgi:hypothetical protein